MARLCHEINDDDDSSLAVSWRCSSLEGEGHEKVQRLYWDRTVTAAVYNMSWPFPLPLTSMWPFLTWNLQSPLSCPVVLHSLRFGSGAQVWLPVVLEHRVWVQGVNDVRGRGVYKHVYSTMCASHPESVKVMHSCRESKSDTESNVCFCPEHVSELLWDVSTYTIISVRSQS